MKLTFRFITTSFVLCLLSLRTIPSFADELRNIKHGEPVPPCKLPAIDGSIVDTEAFKGSVVVYVCVLAEQRRSEQAETDSQQVVKELAGEPVKLVHITADAVNKAYFEKLRQDSAIQAPLLFDPDRTFYGKLGIIAFPTTIIVNREGRLDNVISLHSSHYALQLDAHIRHALGTLSDTELQQRLAPRTAESSSPRSAASAHRALARVMREKGQFNEARAELNKGLELDAANHEIMLDLAELDVSLNDLDAADAALARVLSAQPDHRRAKQIKGTCLFRRGKLDEARRVLEESLVLNPSPELSHYYLGRILEQQGDKDKALQHYREALKHFVHDDASLEAPSPAVPGTPGK